MSTLDMDSVDVIDKPEAAQHSETVSENADDVVEPYQMSWRTVLALFVLSLSWSGSTYATGGTNTAIAYMVGSFPGQEANATWIANSTLFCLVTLPALTGAVSDRYGKKWLLVAGGILGGIGTIVSGRASSIDMIIGGQTITGVGCALILVCVAASMEIVPAKYRPASFASLSLLNTALGSLGGPLIYAACVENDPAGDGEGWRYGFYFECMIFLLGAISVVVGFHPPPTRFRREQTIKQALQSIDFIGVFLLALGAALIVVPLVWGGNSYSWNSAHVVSFLVVGPLILVAFGIYEWKGRRDGLLHHEFFQSRNFPILMGVGAMDGILLYSTGYFIPNQIRALYTPDSFSVIVLFTPLPITLMVGTFICGGLITKMKKLRLPLVLSCVFTTLFCGLMIRCTPDNKSYFLGMISALGFITAAITVVPVAGIGLIVPSHLIATSNNLLSCIRALGGAIGIAIFTAVFNNKTAENFAEYVVPVLTKAGIPAAQYAQLMAIVQNAPQVLPTLPHFTPDLVQAILNAAKTANAESYKWVWVCITAAAAVCTVASLFVKDVPERMTNQIESALEHSQTREKQDHIV